MGGAGDGDLVEALACLGLAVNYEGVAGVEQGHRLGDEWDGVWSVDAHDLRGGSGGVGEGAEEVEDGADAEGSADWHDGLHGGVQRGRMEEGESVPAQSGGGLDGREADGDAEGFEDVG